jgi:tRNA modification GTPase
VVLVVDGSVPPREDDAALVRSTGSRPRVIAVNKADLPDAAGHDAYEAPVVRVSAHSHTGIDDLRSAIAECLVKGTVERDAPAVTNQRHLALLERAHESVARGADVLSHGAPEELALADLQEARGFLDEIVGRRTTDDILKRIFETFCIGK